MVGNESALRLSYDVIRPHAGVHTSPQFPLTGADLYAKNVSLSFGRCPVRSIFDEAIGIMERCPDTFGVGQDLLVEKVVGLAHGGESRVKETYEEFEKGTFGKVIFDPWN